jgi:hypothetical protein
VTPILLVALALIDGAFCGFRDAAGRDPRIEKRAYYRRALLRGTLAALVAVLVLGALTGAALLLAPDGAGLYADLLAVGARMVWVYGGYATLVCAALVVYAIPIHDLSTLMTVIILGPFTMMRPFVIAAGALWAAWGAGRVESIVLALLSALVIGLVERLLGPLPKR